MRENLMCVKITIIIEQIELNCICTKIKPWDYDYWGLMLENLAARKYLRLQYSAYLETGITPSPTPPGYDTTVTGQLPLGQLPWEQLT